MKLFPFFLLFSIFVSGQKSKNTDTTYYFPAEWEPHRGMIVSFDNETRADSVSVNMVKAVCCNTKVYCVIAADSLIPYYKSWFQKENLSLDSIRFILFGLSQPSIRDPIFFLKNDRRDLKIMDFRWVDYGYQPDSAGLKNFLQWNAKDRKLFKDNFLATFPFSTEQSDMVAEGGSIEVNGKGVLLQVESVNMHRNPTLTKEIQEKELKKYLGISKVWEVPGVMLMNFADLPMRVPSF
jgi:agmatine deiminase